MHMQRKMLAKTGGLVCQAAFREGEKADNCIWKVILNLYENIKASLTLSRQKIRKVSTQLERNRPLRNSISGWKKGTGRRFREARVK